MIKLFNLYKGTLIYWSQTLGDHPKKIKFLLTKIVDLSIYLIYSKVQPWREGIKEIKFDYKTVPRPTLPEEPLVGIIVPVFVQKKDIYTLSNLFKSIEQQTFRNFKVFIVDDCSPVNYEVPNYAEKIKTQKNGGPSVARNVGIRKAQETGVDIIAFTDNDCILWDCWLENIVRKFKNDLYTDAISGRTISYGKKWFATYHNMNGTLNGRPLNNGRGLMYGATCNLALRSYVTDKLSFDEEIRNHEDVFFCYNMLNSGFKIEFVDEMRISHDFGYKNLFLMNLIKYIKHTKSYAETMWVMDSRVPVLYDLIYQSSGIFNIDYNHHIGKTNAMQTI